MKLTKTLEAEIKQVMEDYWNSYFAGDLERWSLYLRDDYRNIGSTEVEIWNSKQEILEYSKAVVPQMVGTVEIRNRQVQVIPIEPYYMVHEFVDTFIKPGEEWVFYAKFRLSSLIQKTAEGWKVIHQHGSVPDSKALDGESIGFQNISKENLELREAVKRRTVELEHKNHELEIESSLERVRTVAMSMTKPNDLLNIGEMLFRELKVLGFSELRNTLINTFVDEENYFIDYDYSDLTGGSITRIPYSGHPVIENYIRNIRKGNGAFTEQIVSGKELEQWKEFRRSNGEADDPRLDNIPAVYYYIYSVGAGGIGISTLSSISDEKLKVLKRFSNVFDLAYKRYTDITKAEARSREAQVELALEKIRARTMAMQKSDELAEVSSLLFQQMISLGVNTYSSGFTIWDKDTEELISWMCNADGSINPPFRMPVRENEGHILQYESWKNGEDFFIKDLVGEEMQHYFQYLRSFPLLDEAFNKSIAAGHPMPERQIHHIANFSHGNLMFITLEPSPEAHDIFKRFAKVFDQTYTRFLDLQKAEVQAREAQIEAALERVRSRTMGMQKSEELGEVSHVINAQLQQLNFKNFIAGFFTDYRDSDDFSVCRSDSSGVVLEKTTIPYFDHPVFERFIHAKETGRDFYEVCLTFEEKNKWVEHALRYFQEAPPAVKEFLYTSVGYASSCALLKNVGLFIENFDGIPFSKEENDILMRFAKVFEQTYTRFLDLQKAEAQSREAQIELGLERVRARAMAMQKSDELKELIGTVFTELTKLDLVLARCIIMIYDLATKDSTWWMANSEAPSDPIGLLVQYHEHPTYVAYLKAWQEKTLKWEYVLEGKIKNDWDDFLFTETGLKALPDFVIVGMRAPDKVYLNSSFNSFGSLTLATLNPLSDEHFNIMLRFAKVFDLTYTRFNDLQKAEAQSREARIEASLERVRAKAMSMHSSQDLADTIGLFYHELELFSITPRRCGVGLLNKETRIAELSTMNTNEQGKSIEIIGKIKMEGHPVLEAVYENWLLNKEYHPVLRGNEIKEYYQLLRPQIAFPDYPLDTVQYGYFFFFPEGGVYAWTDKEMGDDELKIYRRFTSVLSLTYKRYKDLQQAEELARQAEQDLINLRVEKKKTEEALAELKTTQFQLIQSEKMASLGELTAGIAHEIQNPLNFVNNFSEVNNELIDEMNAEIGKGAFEEASAIARDIRQNLEKINHHGKRADAIVKGMLQHSRTSNNATKEPSDINQLADEYVRLAYHGLRAKNNSFNATIKTDYDATIGNINIVPQDIGRVILNLITNAFYAVGEKKILNPGTYEPTVIVSTKRLNDKVEIKVADNGNGIPRKILDKIFNPFFTTKPTGQGTGLGLSLAYDIVKVHGGELKVDTKEGEGTTFVIQLPG